MTSADRLVELAKGAMTAAAQLYGVHQRAEYDAWRSRPAKGRKAYSHEVEVPLMLSMFQDIFEEGLAVVRSAAAQEKNEDQVSPQN